MGVALVLVPVVVALRLWLHMEWLHLVRIDVAMLDEVISEESMDYIISNSQAAPKLSYFPLLHLVPFTLTHLVGSFEVVPTPI